MRFGANETRSRRPVRRRRAWIALALATLSCASTDRPETGPAGPPAVVRAVRFPDRVEFEAVVRLEAAPREVEAWLLDFDRVAADRPAVLESSLVRHRGNEWLARFRLRGPLGVHPTALTRTTRSVEGNAVILAFRSVETSFGLDALRGFYRIEPAGEGGTVLTHRLFVDSPFATEEGRRQDLLEDAWAIRARFSSR